MLFNQEEYVEETFDTTDNRHYYQYIPDPRNMDLIPKFKELSKNNVVLMRKELAQNELNIKTVPVLHCPEAHGIIFEEKITQSPLSKCTSG